MAHAGIGGVGAEKCRQPVHPRFLEIHQQIGLLFGAVLVVGPGPQIGVRLAYPIPRTVAPAVFRERKPVQYAPEGFQGYLLGYRR
jgi:hypothetical protein